MVKSEYVFSYIFFSSILLNAEKNEDLGDVGSTGGKDPEPLNDGKEQIHIE